MPRDAETTTPLERCERGDACTCSLADIAWGDVAPLLLAGYSEAEAARMVLMAHRGRLVPFFTLHPVLAPSVLS